MRHLKDLAGSGSHPSQQPTDRQTIDAEVATKLMSPALEQGPSTFVAILPSLATEGKSSGQEIGENRLADVEPPKSHALQICSAA
jgi:hypothetical protein